MPYLLYIFPTHFILYLLSKIEIAVFTCISSIFDSLLLKEAIQQKLLNKMHHWIKYLIAAVGINILSIFYL